MQNITIDEFQELRNRIHRELVASGQDIALGSLASRMLEFENVFPGGLAHMRNYVKWSDEHGYADYILPTVVHDLNDMNEPGMLPRTSDY